MPLKQIANKKWAYTLYQRDESYILSVVCGSVANFDLNIPLSSEEAANALSDPSYLDRLAADISNHAEQFAPRSIDI